MKFSWPTPLHPLVFQIEIELCFLLEVNSILACARDWQSCQSCFIISSTYADAICSANFFFAGEKNISPTKRIFRRRKVKFRRRKIHFYYIKSSFRRRNFTFRQRIFFFTGEKKIRRADGIGIRKIFHRKKAVKFF